MIEYRVEFRRHMPQEGRHPGSGRDAPTPRAPNGKPTPVAYSSVDHLGGQFAPRIQEHRRERHAFFGCHVFQRCCYFMQNRHFAGLSLWATSLEEKAGLLRPVRDKFLDAVLPLRQTSEQRFIGTTVFRC